MLRLGLGLERQGDSPVPSRTFGVIEVSVDGVAHQAVGEPAQPGSCRVAEHAGGHGPVQRDSDLARRPVTRARHNGEVELFADRTRRAEQAYAIRAERVQRSRHQAAQRRLALNGPLHGGRVEVVGPTGHRDAPQHPHVQGIARGPLVHETCPLRVAPRADSGEIVDNFACGERGQPHDRDARLTDQLGKNAGTVAVGGNDQYS